MITLSDFSKGKEFLFYPDPDKSKRLLMDINDIDEPEVHLTVDMPSLKLAHWAQLRNAIHEALKSTRFAKVKSS